MKKYIGTLLLVFSATGLMSGAVCGVKERLKFQKEALGHFSEVAKADIWADSLSKQKDDTGLSFAQKSLIDRGIAFVNSGTLERAQTTGFADTLEGHGFAAFKTELKKSFTESQMLKIFLSIDDDVLAHNQPVIFGGGGQSASINGVMATNFTPVECECSVSWGGAFCNESPSPSCNASSSCLRTQACGPFGSDFCDGTCSH